MSQEGHRLFMLGLGVFSPDASFHLQTLIIYELGFNQNYYTFTLILLIKSLCVVNFVELTL